MCASVLSACLYMHRVCALRSEEGFSSLELELQLEAAMRILGTELESSAVVTSALHC